MLTCSHCGEELVDEAIFVEDSPLYCSSDCADLAGETQGYLSEFRVCDECGEGFNQGYCIESGAEYYCSEECLHKHYTAEEFDDLYDDGNGDSYWTVWYE